MAGTVVESIVKYDKEQNTYNKVVAQFACTGDASGGSVPDTDLSDTLMQLIRGMYLNLILTWPESPAPTNLYDVTLVGKTTALDILGGAGADQSSTAPKQAMPSISSTSQKRLVTESLTLKVANQSVNSAKYKIQLIFTKD